MKQHHDATAHNTRVQNQWNNAVALLRTDHLKFYVHEKGKCDPVGLPAGLDQTIRENLIRDMCSDTKPSTIAGTVGNLED